MPRLGKINTYLFCLVWVDKREAAIRGNVRNEAASGARLLCNSRYERRYPAVPKVLAKEFLLPISATKLSILLYS